MAVVVVGVLPHCGQHLEAVLRPRKERSAKRHEAIVPSLVTALLD
jgi:hypothetical protein